MNRDTAWILTTQLDSGHIWMNGTKDQDNTKYIGENYQVAYGFQPMRFLRITNQDSVPAFGAKLILNNRGNWYSRSEMAAEALRGAGTDKEKALSLFEFIRSSRIHYESAEAGHLDETHEPVKVMGVYGYGLCDDAAFSLVNLAHTGNIGAIEWGLTAHNVAEVISGPEQMVVDGDLEVFYLAQDNNRLAGKHEIAQDRYLATRTLHHGIDIPYDYEFSRHVSNMFTTFDGMIYRNPAPHELYFSLLPEQSVYFTWDRPDYAFEHRIFGLGTTENMWEHHIGNAFWEHSLNPGAPGFSRQFSASLNLLADTSGTGLRFRPLSYLQPLQLVHKVQLPFPQLDHNLYYHLTLPGSGDTFKVEWSLDSMSWTTVKAFSGPFSGMDSCSLYAMVSPQVNPAIYQSFIRVSVLQSNALHAAGMDSLRFQSRTQNSKTFLPYLRIGSNAYTVSRKDSLPGNLTFELAWREDASNLPSMISSVPVYPGNGITTDTAHIRFRWGNAQDPDVGDYPVKCHFQLSDRSDMRHCLASNFDRIIQPIPPSTMPYPAFKPEVNGFLNHGQTYYWRVRGMDSRGLWGDWSPVWSFTVQCVMPPHAGAISLTDSSMVVSWNAGPGKFPAGYAVHGSNEMSGFTPTSETFIGFTQDSAWTFPYDQAPPPAYLRIIALDQNGEESQPSNCINTPFPFVYTSPQHPVYPDSVVTIPLQGNARYYPFWFYFYPDTIFQDTWVSPVAYPPQMQWDPQQSAFVGQFDSASVRAMNFIPALGNIVFQSNAPYSLPTTQAISLEPSIPNLKPQLEHFASNPSIGVLLSDTLDLLDGDADYGDTHNWQVLRCPSWLNTSGSNDRLVLNGTPGYAALVDTVLWLVVEDSKGLSDTLYRTFYFPIQNTPPQFLSAPDTLVDPNVMYVYAPLLFDPDTVLGDSVFLSIEQGPSWLWMNPQTRQLMGYPVVSPGADSLVVLRATDLAGDWVEQVFVLHFKRRQEIQSEDSSGIGIPDEWMHEWTEEDGFGMLLFPNPATEQTKIKFRLPQNGQIQMDLFQADGRWIQEIVSGFRESGVRWITLPVGHLAAGMYWVQWRFTAEDAEEKIYRAKLIVR